MTHDVRLFINSTTPTHNSRWPGRAVRGASAFFFHRFIFHRDRAFPWLPAFERIVDFGSGIYVMRVMKQMEFR